MTIKISRNDPCFCGSGKKYKKCCFGREIPKQGQRIEKYSQWHAPVSFELMTVALIFIFFLGLQLQAIGRGDYKAQDYQRHTTIIRDSAAHPLKTLTAPIDKTGETPSTVYHLIGGCIYRIFGEGLAGKALAIVNVLCNILTLLLFYLFIRRVIRSGLMRVAGLAFIAFLPVTLITAMAIAADAFMPFFFIASAWLLVLIIDRWKKGGWAIGLMALEGALLITGVMVKVSFIAIFVGVVVIGLILCRCGIGGGRRLLLAFFLIIMVPAAITATLWFSYMSQQIPMYENSNVPKTSLAHMDLRSLLFFKKNDAYLLDAPYFHELRFQDGRSFHPMQETNYYSYPALLHLGIFTDVLNIDQPIRYHSNDPWVVDEYDTRVRPQENQERMKLCVRTSLVFSVCIFLALCWLIGACFNALKLGKETEDVPVIVLGVFGLSLFGETMASLPFVPWPYQLGFWLPRFILPSILSFGVILFVAVDRLPLMKSKVARWVMMAMVVGQSMLQISFLTNTNLSDNELDPNLADYYLARGLNYADHGQFREAIADYNKAMEINPNYAEGYNDRGNAYDKQGQITQAMSDYNKAIEINPNDAAAYKNRGSVFYKENKLTQAIADYNKAIDINISDPEAYCNLGSVYAQEGNFAAAKSNFNKAIEKDPKYEQAYNDLGLIDDNQGRFIQAMSDYNKAIALNPSTRMLI